MSDLSPNFSRKMFQCSCCSFDTVDAELLVVLEGSQST